MIIFTKLSQEATIFSHNLTNANRIKEMSKCHVGRTTRTINGNYKNWRDLMILSFVYLYFPMYAYKINYIYKTKPKYL